MAVITSLVSYWELNESSGDALDAHAANDLLDMHTVGAASGKVSGARDFESGSVQYFYNYTSALSCGDIDFSFCAWVKPESLSVSAVCGRHDGVSSTDSEYALYYNGSRFEVIVYLGGASTSVVANTFGAISTATWYFLVLWHDAVNDQIGISVNGVSDTASHSSGTNSSSGPFALGSLKEAIPWDGLIDESGVWNKVLSSGEISWLYNSGAGRSYADIVAEAGSATLPNGHSTGFWD